MISLCGWCIRFLNHSFNLNKVNLMIYVHFLEEKSGTECIHTV